MMAIKLAIVPDGTYKPASFPNTFAVSASKHATEWSSPNTSSPTSANAIAARICTVGFVTVSLRMSTTRSSFGAAVAPTLTRFTAYSWASSSPSGGSS
eukprot:CAMPEP_0177790482 /NCGR_PEP_ID=MMETSP0491_2-20121128/23382_1 /TAXON_ID=63592 /ORGANISM="Tetraselmis chuii, Strain PLY429" /LENGTH=97 /DNA_ID=CAMNT_0019312567 /DNA_START=301 /DNA_END=590 /DNA_ORIENTATION=+